MLVLSLMSTMLPFVKWVKTINYYIHNSSRIIKYVLCIFMLAVHFKFRRARLSEVKKYKKIKNTKYRNKECWTKDRTWHFSFGKSNWYRVTDYNSFLSRLPFKCSFTWPFDELNPLKCPFIAFPLPCSWLLVWYKPFCPM